MKAILNDVMAKAKKIFLLHERRETWRVRVKSKTCGFCPQCEAETVWLTGTQATRFSGLTEREIFRLTENARVHFQENDEGLLLICRKSLEKIREKEE